ncbi:hypothetical protein AVEN_92535-1 [Araneus ventricosus]|uniref:Uncharacterized protein n=1 Tax=Araneus ventricosus TaxID=182803 RepID=A0A4Y2AHN8_ARAVE|nr:hypothetical protein AVEN_92535-1 [Araneus ventricosus]
MPFTLAIVDGCERKISYSLDATYSPYTTGYNPLGTKREFRADQICGSMKPRHLRRLAHFGDPPDGSIHVRESVYTCMYKENIVREHLTGPQHYPDNGLVSGTRGEVSRNQEAL